MAAAASCRRAVRLGTNSGFCFTNLRSLNSFSSITADWNPISAPPSTRFSAALSPNSQINRFDCRQISQLVKPSGQRAFLVDTLALVRRLEAQRIPSKQAEAITEAITEVLNDSLITKCGSILCFKRRDAKVEMLQEANISKFKSEVNSSQVRDRCTKEWTMFRNRMTAARKNTTRIWVLIHPIPHLVVDEAIRMAAESDLVIIATTDPMVLLTDYYFIE